MTSESKDQKHSTIQSTGTERARGELAIDQSLQDLSDGNRQEGVGENAGIGRRIDPNDPGGQPDIGGSVGPHVGNYSGTGLSENSDPTSRNAVPDLSDPAKTHFEDIDREEGV